MYSNLIRSSITKGLAAIEKKGFATYSTFIIYKTLQIIRVNHNIAFIIFNTLQTYNECRLYIPNTHETSISRYQEQSQDFNAPCVAGRIGRRWDCAQARHALTRGSWQTHRCDSWPQQAINHSPPSGQQQHAGNKSCTLPKMRHPDRILHPDWILRPRPTVVGIRRQNATQNDADPQKSPPEVQ